ATCARFLVHLPAVDEPADGVRPPLEGVGVEVLGGVEAEVDHCLVPALAGGVVVELHLARGLAEEFEVDLVVRRIIKAGAGVGKEAGDDARCRHDLEARLEAAVAEEAARLVLAGGEAASGSAAV